MWWHNVISATHAPTLSPLFSTACSDPLVLLLPRYERARHGVHNGPACSVHAQEPWTGGAIKARKNNAAACCGGERERNAPVVARTVRARRPARAGTAARDAFALPRRAVGPVRSIMVGLSGVVSTQASAIDDELAGGVFRARAGNQVSFNGCCCLLLRMIELCTQGITVSSISQTTQRTDDSSKILLATVKNAAAAAAAASLCLGRPSPPPSRQPCPPLPAHGS